MNQDFAICIQFSKENLRKTIDLCYNIDVSRALLASEREVFLFSPFSSLAKVNNVLQSEQRKDSKEIYLFLDGDVPLPRSSIYLALRDIFHPYFPSRTFLPSNYFFLLLLFRRPLPPSDISSLCCFPPGRKLCGNAVSSDLNFRI